MGEVQIRIVPGVVLENQSFLLIGSGFSDCPATIELGGKPALIESVQQGQRTTGGVRPRGGRFAVRISNYGKKPGKYELTVASHGQRGTLALTVGARDRPTRGEEDDDVGLGFWRNLAEFERRFGVFGYVPSGVTSARLRSIAALRARQQQTLRPTVEHPLHGGVFFSPPVFGGTNWTPVGPAPIISGGPASQPANTGRILRGRHVDREQVHAAAIEVRGYDNEASKTSSAPGIPLSSKRRREDHSEGARPRGDRRPRRAPSRSNAAIGERGGRRR